jgi:hypothetical protein
MMGKMTKEKKEITRQTSHKEEQIPKKVLQPGD